MTDRINHDLGHGRLHAVLGSEDWMQGGYEKTGGEKLEKKNNNNMQCFKELCCKETWRNRTAAGRMWSRAFVRMGDIESTSSWWQWWWVCTCFSCLTPCCISDLYVSSSDKASAITCPDICVLSPPGFAISGLQGCLPWHQDRLLS